MECMLYIGDKPQVKKDHYHGFQDYSLGKAAGSLAEDLKLALSQKLSLLGKNRIAPDSVP